MQHKPNSDKPQKRGARREKLHNEQNNRGNAENKPQYKDFDGNPIE